MVCSNLSPQHGDGDDIATVRHEPVCDEGRSSTGHDDRGLLSRRFTFSRVRRNSDCLDARLSPNSLMATIRNALTAREVIMRVTNEIARYEIQRYLPY